MPFESLLCESAGRVRAGPAAAALAAAGETPLAAIAVVSDGVCRIRQRVLRAVMAGCGEDVPVWTGRGAGSHAARVPAAACLVLPQRHVNRYGERMAVGVVDTRGLLPAFDGSHATAHAPTPTALEVSMVASTLRLASAVILAVPSHPEAHLTRVYAWLATMEGRARYDLTGLSGIVGADSDGGGYPPAGHPPQRPLPLYIAGDPATSGQLIALMGKWKRRLLEGNVFAHITVLTVDEHSDVIRQEVLGRLRSGVTARLASEAVLAAHGDGRGVAEEDAAAVGVRRLATSTDAIAEAALTVYRRGTGAVGGVHDAAAGDDAGGITDLDGAGPGGPSITVNTWDDFDAAHKTAENDAILHVAAQTPAAAPFASAFPAVKAARRLISQQQLTARRALSKASRSRSVRKASELCADVDTRLLSAQETTYDTYDEYEADWRRVVKEYKAATGLGPERNEVLTQVLEKWCLPNARVVHASIVRRKDARIRELERLLAEERGFGQQEAVLASQALGKAELLLHSWEAVGAEEATQAMQAQVSAAAADVARVTAQMERAVADARAWQQHASEVRAAHVTLEGQLTAQRAAHDAAVAAHINAREALQLQVIDVQRQADTLRRQVDDLQGALGAATVAAHADGAGTGGDGPEAHPVVQVKLRALSEDVDSYKGLWRRAADDLKALRVEHANADAEHTASTTLLRKRLADETARCRQLEAQAEAASREADAVREDMMNRTAPIGDGTRSAGSSVLDVSASAVAHASRVHDASAAAAQTRHDLGQIRDELARVREAKLAGTVISTSLETPPPGERSRVDDHDRSEAHPPSFVVLSRAGVGGGGEASGGASGIAGLGGVPRAAATVSLSAGQLDASGAGSHGALRAATQRLQDAEAQGAALRAQVDNLAQELREAHDQLQDTRDRAAAADDRAAIADAKREDAFDKLEALQRRHADRAEALEFEARSCGDERSQALSTLAATEADLTAARVAVSRLERDVGEKEQTIAALRSSIAKTESMLSQQQAVSRDALEQQGRMERERDVLDTQLREAQHARASAEALCETYRAASDGNLQDAKAAKEELQQLRADTSARMKELEAKVKDRTAALVKAEGDLTHANGAMQRAEDQRLMLDRDLSQAKSDLQEAKLARKKDVGELRRKLADAETALMEAEAKAKTEAFVVQEELTGCQQRLAAAMRAREDAEERVTTAQNDAAMKGVEIETLQRALGMEKAELERVMSSLALMTSLDSKAADTRGDDSQRLREALADMQREHQESRQALQETVKSQKEQLAKLQLEAARLREREALLACVEAEAKDLRRAVQEKSSELAQVTAKLGVVEASLQGTADMQSLQERENERVVEAYAGEQKRLKEMLGDIERRFSMDRNGAVDVARRLAEAEERCRALESSGGLGEAATARLRTALAASEGMLKTAGDRIRELEADLGKRDDALAMLKAKANAAVMQARAHADEERTAAAAHAAELETKVRRLTAELGQQHHSMRVMGMDNADERKRRREAKQVRAAAAPLPVATGVTAVGVTTPLAALARVQSFGSPVESDGSSESPRPGGTRGGYRGRVSISAHSTPAATPSRSAMKQPRPMTLPKQLSTPPPT